MRNESRAWKVVCIGALLVSAFFISGGCGDACPPGYEKAAGFCKLAGKDGGPTSTDTQTVNAAGAGNGSVSTPTSSGTGSTARTPTSNSPTGTATAGSAGGSSTPTSASAGKSGTASSATAGSSSSSSSSTNAAGSDAPTAGSTGTAEPTGPCAGHAGESVCEGVQMHHCAANGSAAAPESCMSAALCEIGAASGMCAVCNPGTFHCDGVQLSVCTDAGQLMKKEDCASAALCNVDAGECTELKCMPSSVACSSDGSTLNTCNADGSAFANQMSCGGKGCNGMLKKCNQCMPGEKMCSGTSGFTTCNADGQSTKTSQCTATGGACGSVTCEGGACVQGTMSPGSTCTNASGGKKCDARGQCVACLSPDDCPDVGKCKMKTCNGTCGGTPTNEGGECGTNMVCAKGDCIMKNPCKDGVFDPTKEECDPTSKEWEKSDGACSDSCKLTIGLYHACAEGGGACWQGSPAPYFCSAVGTCSRLCTPGSNDCGPGQCVQDKGRPSQSICITNSCQQYTSPQWFGRQGCFEPTPSGDCMGAPVPQQMCGWLSADPTTGKLWCPGEHAGDCCPPPGSSRACIKK